jgi:hypothetical protein
LGFKGLRGEAERVFENRVLRKISWLKKEDIA